jgi:hypothetical protein
VLNSRWSFLRHVGPAGCSRVVLNERGLVLRECGFEQGLILTERGHENELFSRQATYVLGQLHLGAGLVGTLVWGYVDLLISTYL